MGRFIVLTGVAKCPVDRQDAVVELQVSVILPPDDAPTDFAVGDSLTPFFVEDVVELLVTLHPRADAERGTALFLWFCARCSDYHWARVRLDTVGEDAVLVGIDVVPSGVGALDEADWIDPELLEWIVLGTRAEGVVPRQGRLSPEQYQALVGALSEAG